MYTQQQDSYASAARVAEYEEEIRALFQRLVALEQHNRDLRSLSDEVRQTYDATLDNLAALQLQLHLSIKSYAHARTQPVGRMACNRSMDRIKRYRL